MLVDANRRSDSAGKPRLSSADRRAAIVSAAIETFAKGGFRGTTTRELAAAVGVTEPVLYQHFQTKKDLYTAIIDTMVGQVKCPEVDELERLAGGSDDQAFFRTLASAIYSWYVRENSHIRLLLFSALEGHGLAELWHEKAEQLFLPFIERYIARRSAEGAFIVASPAIATRAFLSLIAQFGQLTTIFRRRIPGMEPEAALDEYVRIFLDGIRHK
jgi:TetR/AcrR family transcriptional regulator